MARLDFTDTLTVDHDRLERYLTTQGFSQDAPGRWKRGGLVGAWLGLTPKNWPAEVTIVDGQVSLAVRATGQILTRAETAFWEQEWDNLRSAATGQLTDTVALAHRRDVSFVENTLILAVPFPFAVATAFAAVIMVGPWAGFAAFIGTLVVMYVIGVGWLMVRK